jgi:hypothetical protein
MFTLRRAAVCLALCLSLLLTAAAAFAVPHVRGYTRKDGTYVRPHYRRPPGTGAYTPRSSPRRYSYSPPARTFPLSASGSGTEDEPLFDSTASREPRSDLPPKDFGETA